MALGRGAGQVCNSDLTEKKAFLEARCAVAEARLAELEEEHRRGVAERDRSIAALERREAGGRLVVDALLLDDIQVPAAAGGGGGGGGGDVWGAWCEGAVEYGWGSTGCSRRRP